jgi:hypothetical protein
VHKTTLLGPTVSSHLDRLPYWAHASISVMGTIAVTTAPIWLTILAAYISGACLSVY